MYALLANFTRTNSDFDYKNVQKVGSELGKDIDGLDMQLYLTNHECIVKEGEASIYPLLVMIVVCHIIQYFSSLFVFRKKALKYFDNKTFKSTFIKLSFGLLIIHVAIVAYVTTLMNVKVNNCQKKFLPAVWADIVLGFLSIPMIYAGYRMNKHKEKINL